MTRLVAEVNRLTRSRVTRVSRVGPAYVILSPVEGIHSAPNRLLLGGALLGVSMVCAVVGDGSAATVGGSAGWGSPGPAGVGVGWWIGGIVVGSAASGAVMFAL